MYVLRFHMRVEVCITHCPIPEKKWEYRFFVDFEGNLSDSGVKNALYGISREVNNLRILGNY